jgi:hypothetical protein
MFTFTVAITVSRISTGDLFASSDFAVSLSLPTALRRNGRTALMLAASTDNVSTGRVRVVELLISAGAELAAKSNNG